VTTPALTVTPLSQTEVLISGGSELNTWREAQRIKVPGHEYSPRFKIYEGMVRRYKQQGMDGEAARMLAKEKGWDGTWAPGKWCRLIGEDMYELRCSYGLLYRVLTGLQQSDDQQVDTALLKDAADYLAAHPRSSELTDYQVQSFQTALLARWSRVALATNAGKGAVIAMLADFLRLRKLGVAIMCDEISVYDALLGQLDEWAGLSPVLVRSGVKEPPPKGAVSLVMIPTLTKRLKEDPDAWKPWLEQTSMLLLDEADKATADSWRAVCRAAKNTKWRVGFSGTFPTDLTHDDWLLEEIMGPILVRVKNLELIERGISARPKIELRGFDVTNGIGKLPSWDDWRAASGPGRRQWAYEQTIMENSERHAFVRGLIRPTARTAIIVNRVPHGQRLAEEIPDAVFLDGSLTEAQRRHELERFEEGKVQVIIVTKILDRGTNRLGHVTDLIFASSEGSDRQTLQRIGRGLRRADGKAFLRLVDIVDRVTCDTYDDRRLQKVADFIHEAGRKRLELYQAEGFDVEVVL
jgi:superfamily II DNA or RNA helicase